LIFALLVLVKIVSIQFFNGGELVEQAEKQTYKLKKVKAPRGNIFADNDQKTSLALSVPRYEIHMDLITVKENVFHENVYGLADSLSKIFSYKTKEDWLKELIAQRDKKNRYHLIQKSIRNDELARLENFPIFNLGQYSGGLIVLKENKRVKPYKKLAARTIGYVREKQDKYVGLEGAFNDELKGRDGEMLMERIRGNNWKPIESEFSREPIPGCDIYSSIDVNIQDVAETPLMKQLKNQKALRGCVVLMEVKTGFIKAIANLTQDADKKGYSESLNHAVGLASEPGSTFKLASLMVALDDEKIKITDSVLMNGTYRFYKKYSLNDGNKVYGKNTIQVAFEKSSNIISKIIDDSYKTNPQQFVDGLKRIGLDKKLGIPIVGEGTPYIKDVDDPLFSGISLPWMSIGYEVKITPLQTLTFYNAVANNGVMVKPLFVREIRFGNEVRSKFEKEIINPKICKNSTLKDVQIMLKGVVERGTAKNIKARGFDIAGKTGTSKIAINSKGYGSKYQASFCGYFPADNPMYSCIVVIQGPTTNIYGSIVSGTVFKEIADKVYALGNMENKEIEMEDLYYPFSKHGNKIDFVFASSKMKIPLKKESGVGKWVHTIADEDGVRVKNKRVVNDKIPNVIGMGLNDALFLLEDHGLQVKVKGSGFVRNQSINPGNTIIKGQLITIDLS
jgi:cell division protein FtsI (penicillin-binding protein 3)